MSKIYTKVTAVVWFLFAPLMLKSQNIDHQFKPFIKTDPYINAIVVQSDGKVIVGGDIASVGDIKTSNLVRLNTDGSLDMNYRLPLYRWAPYSMVIDNKDRLYIMEELEGYRQVMHRLLPDGSVDEEFKVDESIESINHFVAQGNKCVVNANFWKNGSYESFICRLDETGKIDNSFTIFQKEEAYMRLVIQPDNKILIFGLVDDDPFMIRLNQDGISDESFKFTAELKGNYPEISQIIPQKDGKYLISGRFDFYNDIPVPNFFRLNSDGSFDHSFVLPGPTTNTFSNSLRSIFQFPSGKYVAMGFVYDPEKGSFYRLIGLNEDGSLNTNFKIHEIFNYTHHYSGLTPIAYSEVGVIIGGGFNLVEDKSVNGIVAFDEQGIVQSNFFPDLGGLPSIDNLLRLSNGEMIIRGNFTEINNLKAPKIAKVLSTGQIDTIFNQNIASGPIREVFSLAEQKGDKILVGGSFKANADQDQLGVIRLNIDGSFDTEFDSDNQLNNLNSYIHKIYVIDSNDILLAGMNNRYSSNDIENLININSDGVINETLQLDLTPENYSISDMIVSQDNIIVAGSQFDSSGNTFGYIERFNSEGLSDSLFVTDEVKSYGIRTLLQTNNKKILAAGEYVRSHGDNEVNPVLQIDSTGQFVDLFSVGVNGLSTISEILQASDTTYILAGQFNKINRVFRKGLAMFDLKGRVYNDFRFDLNGEARGVIREDEEHVLVYGSFSQVNDFPGFSGIVRINITTPRPPSDLLVSVDKALGIRLQWLDSSDYETGFRIYRQSGEDEEYVLIDSVEANVTTYWDQNIDPASTYAYKVVSMGDTLVSDFSNTARATTSEISLPAAPAGLNITLKSGSIYLAWEDRSDNEIGFILERAEGNGFVPIDTVYSSSYTDMHGDLKTAYRYQVKAYNVAGESAYSQEAVYDPQRITAIGEEIETDEKAFPNPSEGIFTIEVETKGLQKSDISLYNTQGKGMTGFGIEMGNQNIRVDLSAYQEGVYFLMVRMKNSETPKVFRLIRRNQ